ncbi:MAG TPA: hypothetical protein VFA11_10240 [Acidimicrobiales bacterium]|nr:hypothetical protein [Acidimicrobiales bacterium]
MAAAVAAGMSAVGVAWAAGLTVTAQKLTAGSAAVPGFYPVSVATTNVTGGTRGLAETGDILTVVFSPGLNPATLCSSWPSRNQKVKGTVAINDNAGSTGNDTLTVGAINGSACGGTFTFGTVDLGSAGYVTGGSVSFTNSTITLSSPMGSPATLVITLGSASGTGTPTRVTSGNPAIYTPATAIQNTSGVSIGANTSSTPITSVVQF